MSRTLGDIWVEFCSEPHHPFIIGPDGDLNRADLVHLVGRFTSTFDREGLNEGDRLLIITRNEHVSISAFIACLLNGLVPVLLTPDLPDFRRLAIQRSIEARLSIVDDSHASRPLTTKAIVVPDISGGQSQSTPFQLLKRQKPCGNRLADALGLVPECQHPLIPTDPDGLAYILFTSGTTQAPSGVMVGRRSLLANTATIGRVLNIDRHARLFNDMVLSHADGLVQGPLLAFSAGCALVRTGRFSLAGIEDWLNRVRSTRATHFITVPTVWSMIMRHAQHDDYFDAPEFKHLSSVAAPLSPALWRSIETRFDRPLTNQYGLTETVASALYAGPSGEAGNAGTIGKPVDCEARLAPVADEMKAGELQLRGDNLFSGYWRDPARTQQAFTSDGWLKTGDLAVCDDHGSYQIIGRLKTVILTAGILVRPEEIDEALRDSSGVQDAATVSLDHPEFGEIIVSAVVPERSASTDAITLTAQLRERLEPLKIPKHIVFFSAIPRGAAGKPQIAELRARLTDALASNDADATPHTRTIEDTVFEVAGSVFHMPRHALSPRTSVDDIAAWDSFAHIALILEVEKKLGLRLPPSKVSSIRNLGNAIEAFKAMNA